MASNICRKQAGAGSSNSVARCVVPALDLLMWELGPTNDQVDLMMNNVGRFRELSSWRKEFTEGCLEESNENPHNDAVEKVSAPFVISICKHLVQSFYPVQPIHSPLGQW